MKYTLDTDAIRKRFAEAIIGIREDGTMAVLVRTEGAYGSMPYFDLVHGASHLCDEFLTLIRPGDECEVKLRPSIKWKRAKYFGFHAGHYSYFMASTSDMVTAWDSIRPLPAPVAEAKPTTAPEGQWISVNDRLPEKGSRILLHDCNEDGEGFGVLTGRYSDAGWYLEGDFSGDATITHWMPLPIPPITPVAETVTCPECEDELVKYTSLITDEVTFHCPTCRRKENDLSRRLSTIEQELAAIRVEMKGTQ